MRSYAAHVPVVTFAMYNKAADVFADKMRFSLWETEVIVKTPVGSLQIITPLIARHNVYNILAAVAVGLAVTVDGEPIPLKVSWSCTALQVLCKKLTGSHGSSLAPRRLHCLQHARN